MTSIQLATSVTARLQESKRNKKIKHYQSKINLLHITGDSGWMTCLTEGSVFSSPRRMGWTSKEPTSLEFYAAVKSQWKSRDQM